MNLIRRTMNDFIASKYTPQQDPTQAKDEHVNLFYKNQMHSSKQIQAGGTNLEKYLK